MALKQLRFLRALTDPRTESIVQAGVIAGYNHPNVESFKALNRIRKNPQLSGILARAGLLPYTIAKKIRKGMEATNGQYFEGMKVADEPNWQARARYTELAVKITGLDPEKNTGTGLIENRLSDLLAETLEIIGNKNLVEADYSVVQPRSADTEQSPALLNTGEAKQ